MMHQDVDRFVQLNRALGKKFVEQETSLRAFANFAAERSIKHVTSAVATEWAAGASSPLAEQARFNRIRALAVFLHAEDARHEIPGAGLMGRSTETTARPAYSDAKPDQSDHAGSTFGSRPDTDQPVDLSQSVRLARFDRFAHFGGFIPSVRRPERRRSHDP